jgi:hypothetical protein
MACDIRLYDSVFASLTAAVQVVPINTSATGRPNLCTAVTNGSSGSVHLPFPITRCVYQVAVVDPARVYGGVTIPSLNGNVAGQLEVVLRPLPTASPGGGAAITSTTQLASYMVSQGWTDLQRAAVLDVANALRLLRPSLDPIVRYFVSVLEYTPEERLIPPYLF